MDPITQVAPRTLARRNPQVDERSKNATFVSVRKSSLGKPNDRNAPRSPPPVANAPRHRLSTTNRSSKPKGKRRRRRPQNPNNYISRTWERSHRNVVDWIRPPRPHRHQRTNARFHRCQPCSSRSSGATTTSSSRRRAKRSATPFDVSTSTNDRATNSSSNSNGKTAAALASTTPTTTRPRRRRRYRRRDSTPRVFSRRIATRRFAFSGADRRFRRDDYRFPRRR